MTLTAILNDTSNSENDSERIRIPLVWITILLTGMILVSFTGNTLVCIAVFIQPSLRNITYYPVLSLAIADLSCAIFAMPAYTLKKFSFDESTETIICDVFRYSYFFTEYASVLSLTAVSIERFLAIQFPMKWHKGTLARYLILALLILWLEVALVSSIPFYWQHSSVENCHYKPTSGWSVLVIVTQVFIPFLIITLCYCSIYNVVRRHQKHIKAHTVLAERHLPLHRTQGHVFVAWKTERKSTLTLALVLGVFVVCWGPSTIYYFLQTVCDECFSTKFHRKGESLMKAVVKLLTFFNSCVNPIIYCWRSKDFRAGFSRLVNRSRRRDLPALRSQNRRNALVAFNFRLIQKKSQNMGIQERSVGEKDDFAMVGRENGVMFLNARNLRQDVPVET